MKILSLFLATSMLFAMMGNTYSQEQKTNASLQSLVEAEKNFSKTFAEKGFRDSFISFFAEDGIGFGPHPEKTKESLSKAPADTFPLATLLTWQPVFADISSSGEFGFTTGPLLITDQTPQKRPARHGMYFSVWKKQSDGSWKVAIDMGVGTPEAIAPITTDFNAAKLAGKL
jgi:ketosteroid isomerase-like protein